MSAMHGRTDSAIISRDAGLQSGSGRVRMNDGWDADLVFSSAPAVFNSRG